MNAQVIFFYRLEDYIVCSQKLVDRYLTNWPSFLRLHVKKSYHCHIFHFCFDKFHCTIDSLRYTIFSPFLGHMLHRNRPCALHNSLQIGNMVYQKDSWKPEHSSFQQEIEIWFIEYHKSWYFHSKIVDSLTAWLAGVQLNPVFLFPPSQARVNLQFLSGNTNFYGTTV